MKKEYENKGLKKAKAKTKALKPFYFPTLNNGNGKTILASSRSEAEKTLQSSNE